MDGNRSTPLEHQSRNHLFAPLLVFVSLIRLPVTTFCSAAAFRLDLNCCFNVGGFGLAAGRGFVVGDLPPSVIDAALGDAGYAVEAVVVQTDPLGAALGDAVVGV